MPVPCKTNAPLTRQCLVGEMLGLCMYTCVFLLTQEREDSEGVCFIDPTDYQDIPITRSASKHFC